MTKRALSRGWQRRWWTFPPQWTESVRLPQSIDLACPPQRTNIHYLASDSTPLTSQFLIGTPRLEFPVTSTKQSPAVISNRDRSGVFSSKFSTRGRPDRSIGIPIHKQDRAQRATNNSSRAKCNTACAASPAQAFGWEAVPCLQKLDRAKRDTACAASPAQAFGWEALPRLQKLTRAERATACAASSAQAFALEGTRPLARGNCAERATTCAAPPAQPPDREENLPNKSSCAKRDTTCAAPSAQAFRWEAIHRLQKLNRAERATTCADSPAQARGSEGTFLLHKSSRARRATICAAPPAQAFTAPITNHSPAREPERGPLITDFLIGTPRLEFSVTSTKQSPAVISNRDRSGVFSITFSKRARPAPSTDVTTSIRVTNHKSPVTSHDFSPSRVLGRPCILRGDTHQCMCLRLETLGLASQALFARKSLSN